MARPVLVGSIDGHPHLHNLVTRNAQLATLLATDLIIGLCNLASLDTRVSTSDDEIEVCGPIGGPLIWTIAQSGPWLVVGGAIGSPTD